jgi:hypothetical protein
MGTRAGALAAHEAAKAADARAWWQADLLEARNEARKLAAELRRLSVSSPRNVLGSLGRLRERAARADEIMRRVGRGLTAADPEVML